MAKKQTTKSKDKPTQTEIDGFHFQLCWELIAAADFPGKEAPKVIQALKWLDDKHTECAEKVKANASS